MEKAIAPTNEEGLAQYARDGDIVFYHTWVLWEMYKKPDKKRSEGKFDCGNPIVEFSTINEFGQIWNTLPHCKICSLLFGDDIQDLREYEIEKDRWETIDGLLLFKKGIEPKWEHAGNIKGGEFTMQLLDLDTDIINTVWENTVLSLIGESFPNSGNVTGIRFLNRVSTQKCMKYEVWVDFQSSAPIKNEMEAGIKSFLEKECKLDSRKINKIQFSDHKQ